MDCHYYDAGVCRSCTLMGSPYARQLTDKTAAAAGVLAEVIPSRVWREPFASKESHFRNKAKLVVAGRPGRATFGILDGRGEGVDLRGCGLYEPGLHDAIAPILDLVDSRGIEPYDVPRRRGELKHLLLTHSPEGEVMVRFVLRSTQAVNAIRGLLPALRAHTGVRVVSVNLQPEHKAIIEGPEEVLLTTADTLPMAVNGIALHLRPNSFFQTNTDVAAGVYRTAADWIDAISPAVVWDLYCGVGGFALHTAAPGRRVFGVEVSPDAITSARRSAAELPSGERTATTGLEFAVGDATTAYESGWPAADLVIVNPPRRGLDAGLCTDLEAGSASHVLYSSCNPTTLARDLARLPSFTARAARLFDMFPQTRHSEVLVLLSR